jgi:hypothetical protein
MPSQKNLFIFFPRSYVYSRLTLSTALSLDSFLFRSLRAGAVSWSDCLDNRAKLAQRPFEYSLSRQHWFIGLRDTISLLLLLLQQLPPSYLRLVRQFSTEAPATVRNLLCSHCAMKSVLKYTCLSFSRCLHNRTLRRFINTALFLPCYLWILVVYFTEKRRCLPISIMPSSIWYCCW